MESNHYSSVLGSKNDVVCARVGGANTTPISFMNFFATYFAERNLNGGDFEKRSVPKPARIPPQTPPAGGKSAEAGRIHSPRQIVSPCLARISNFNHLDSARNSFELCPTNTAKIQNSNFGQKYGRREAPSVLHSPHKILILQRFATLRVAPRLPIQFYE
jgi:hypothetical protein